jgi:hypothetical protein
MSSPNQLHSIGDYVIALQAIPPQSSVAATINGNTIDRLPRNYPLSCVIHEAIGAISGAPSATGVSTKIQQSPDGSTWSDYASTGSGPALTAANTDTGVPVDLSSAMRFVRVVMTVAFTGGTTPAALVAADLIIGGETRLAAA